MSVSVCVCMRLCVCARTYAVRATVDDILKRKRENKSKMTWCYMNFVQSTITTQLTLQLAASE